MWIRMLIAGHDIHVLPDELTAFRIRADNANMSAPRPDTILRSKFEAGKVLRHFAAFDTALFDEVFGDAAGETSVAEQSPAPRVAELALRDPRLEYQSFALDIFHETARDTDDFDRLRTLAGCVDALGSRTILGLCRNLESQQQTIARLTEAALEQDRRLAEMAEARARDQRTIARLESDRRDAASAIEVLRRQLETALAARQRIRDLPP
jgi:hypothetical protein